MVKNLPDNAGDNREVGSIPGLGRFPGEGNGDLLQYSRLENSMDRGAQCASGRYKALPENYVIFEDCDKNRNNKKSQKFEFFLVPNVKKKLLVLSSLTAFLYNLNL